ncbi:unnamed protein product [Darwinula stevensoni]|uniref:SUN domain-containing protein n=1 Tax=Darwinula stevensoni TaxID=69355 RepID=A0A7R8XE56_9CRUS|nr:unnamed protein product [Darwinula stevensoni]CAG0894998.1 unnamed protein product [Darwinula stevensoni]
MASFCRGKEGRREGGKEGRREGGVVKSIAAWTCFSPFPDSESPWVLLGMGCRFRQMRPGIPIPSPTSSGEKILSTVRKVPGTVPVAYASVGHLLLSHFGVRELTNVGWDHQHRQPPLLKIETILLCELGGFHTPTPIGIQKLRSDMQLSTTALNKSSTGYRCNQSNRSPVVGSVGAQRRESRMRFPRLFDALPFRFRRGSSKIPRMNLTFSTPIPRKVADSIKYLVIIIRKNLDCEEHFSSTSTKADRVVGSTKLGPSESSAFTKALPSHVQDATKPLSHEALMVKKLDHNLDAARDSTNSVTEPKLLSTEVPHLQYSAFHSESSRAVNHISPTHSAEIQEQNLESSNLNEFSKVITSAAESTMGIQAVGSSKSTMESDSLKSSTMGRNSHVKLNGVITSSATKSEVEIGMQEQLSVPPVINPDSESPTTTRESSVSEEIMNSGHIGDDIPAFSPSAEGNEETQESLEAPKLEELKPQAGDSQENSMFFTENGAKHHEDSITTFNEWAKQKLEEAQRSTSNASANGNGGKRRLRNFASLACGAKLLSANVEAQRASAVLSGAPDEYLLSPCKARVYFVVELCEAIQPSKFELANLELYSSSPREFLLSMSDHWPCRNWTLIGKYEARDDHSIQNFTINPNFEYFGKYLKVEVLSHYGSEHYCPISLFRVYGTSEFEALDQVQGYKAHGMEEVIEGEEELMDSEREARRSVGHSLFGSAREAIMNIVKKAAEAFRLSPPAEVLNETLGIPELEDFPGCACPLQEHSKVVEGHKDVWAYLSCHPYNVTQWKEATSSCLYCVMASDNQSAGPLPSSPGNQCVCPLSSRFFLTLIPRTTISGLLLSLRLSHLEGPKSSCPVNQSHPDALNLSGTSQNPMDVDVLLEPSRSSTMHPIHHETSSDAPDVLNSMDASPDSGDLMSDSQFLLDMEHDKSASEMTDFEIQPSTASGTAKLTQEETSTRPAMESDVKMTSTKTVDSTNEALQSLIQPNETVAEDFQEVIPSPPSEQLSLFDPSTLSSTPGSGANQPPQNKETAFLRLSNRVRTLELNLSLSTQYLEELSRRYKRQVEDLSKAFNRSQQQLADALQALKIQEHLLQEMNGTIILLLDSNQPLQYNQNVMIGILVIFETVAMALLVLCLNRSRSPPLPRSQSPPPLSRALHRHPQSSNEISTQAFNGSHPPASSSKPQQKKTPYHFLLSSDSKQRSYSQTDLSSVSIPRNSIEVLRQVPKGGKSRQKKKEKKQQHQLLRSLSSSSLSSQFTPNPMACLVSDVKI